MIVIDIKNNKIIKMIFLIKLEMKLNDLNDSNFQKEKMKKNYLKNKTEKSRIKKQKNEYDDFENGNDTKRIKDLLLQKQEKYLMKNQTFSYALQRLQELFISRAKRR